MNAFTSVFASPYPPILPETFVGHLLPPFPLNVGPQDGIDTLVINNIGRGRGVAKCPNLLCLGV